MGGNVRYWVLRCWGLGVGGTFIPPWLFPLAREREGMFGIGYCGVGFWGLGAGVEAPQVFYCDLGAPGLAGATSGAPTGRDITAQGSALGQGSPPNLIALKGQDTKEALCFIPPLQGGSSRATSTQGDALGCSIPPFQGLASDKEQPSCVG